MCYEESLFQRWTRRRAQQRQQKVQSELERASPAKQPTEPITLAAAPANPTRKEVEREVEIA